MPCADQAREREGGRLAAHIAVEHLPIGETPGVIDAHDIAHRWRAAGAVACGALEPDAALQQRETLGAIGRVERRLLEVMPRRRLRERLRRVFRGGLLGSGGKRESGERTGREKGQFHRRSFNIIHLADNSLPICMVCIELLDEASQV